MKLHRNTPLAIALGILINIALIAVCEIFLLYRTPMPPSAEFLAKADSRYENCSVYGDINMDASRGVRYFLVKTASGEMDLVPLQMHSFSSSHARLVKGKLLQNLDLTQNFTTRQIYGGNIYTVTISDGHINAYLSSGTFQQAAFAKYMVLGLLLSFLELFLWQKLRGND